MLKRWKDYLKSGKKQMHASYNIFLQEVINCHAIISAQEILRHYRKWQKSTHGEYKIMGKSGTVASIATYIASNTPTPEMLLLSECAENLSISLTVMLVRWLQKKDIAVYDTLFGHYITEQGYQQLERYCNFRSLKVLFNKRIKHYLGETVSTSDGDFNAFKKQCENADFSLEKLEFINTGEINDFHYPPELHLEIVGHLDDWIAVWYCGQQPERRNSIRLVDAAKEFEISAKEMFRFIKQHPRKYCSKRIYYWIYDTSFQEWKDAIADADDLIPLVCEIQAEHYKSLRRREAIEAIIESCITDGFTYIFCGDSLPGGSASKWYYKKSRIKDVTAHIFACFDELPLFPIAELRRITGFQNAALIEKVKEGAFQATCKDGIYRVSKNEIRRVAELVGEYIGLDEVIAPLMAEIDTAFRYDIAECRNHLHDFIEGNAWWGMTNISASEIKHRNTFKNVYYIRMEDAERLRKPLHLWLAGYKRNYRDKIRIVLDHYKQRFPKTCKKLWDYFNNENSSGLSLDDAAVKNAIDFLLPLLSGELYTMSEESIDEDIIVPFADEAPNNCCRAIAAFLKDCGFTKRQYEFDSLGGTMDTSAYPLQDFAIMAYSTINMEAWEQNQLIEKAVFNKRYADCWIFTALHLFAAWRSSDYVRLVAPILPYSAQEVLERIQAGTFSSSNAEGVVRYFIAEVKGRGMRPNKTAHCENIPELHMFVPTSCEVPLGIILSIAAAHYELEDNGEAFIQQVNDIRTIRGFFGRRFAEACGNKNFLTRRANKSLMQGVSEITDDDESGRPKPYLLASIMRSHKGGYGTLPETTAIYLKDANFSGYTPEYILYQMFERGVCSFVVDILLGECFGKAYKRLPVSSQTALIKDVGLTASAIEPLARAVQTAQDNALVLAREVLGSANSTQVKAQRIFNAIIDGEATGKRTESICLMRAAGHTCKIPLRTNCAGCPYEIRTKASLAFYISEFQRLSRELRDNKVISIPAERMRREYALKRVIFPAIAEIYTCSKAHTSSTERLEYGELIKGVLGYGGNSNSQEEAI